jgi:transcriptional regulator with XRE-family HTH domain
MRNLERNRQTPILDMLNRVARALGVTLADFFSPLDEPYRVRVGKPRRDGPRAARLSGDAPYTHGIGHVPAVVGVIE